MPNQQLTFYFAFNQHCLLIRIFQIWVISIWYGNSHFTRIPYKQWHKSGSEDLAHISVSHLFQLCQCSCKNQSQSPFRAKTLSNYYKKKICFTIIIKNIFFKNVLYMIFNSFKRVKLTSQRGEIFLPTCW